MTGYLSRAGGMCRSLLLPFGAAFLLSCRSETATDASLTPFEGSPQALTCGSGNANSGVGSLVRFYACDETIRFLRYSDGLVESGTFDSSGTQAMITALDAAGLGWNGDALGAGTVHLPQFVVGAGTRTIMVKYSGGNTSNPWCGQVLGAGDAEIGPGVPPAVIKLGHGACGTMDQVARHELAHVLGILGDLSSTDWHNKHPPAVVGHCAFAITSGVLGQSSCPHLKEIMFGLYGVITRPIDATKHIVTSISGNEGHTLPVGQTASAVPTLLMLDVANYSVTHPGATGAELAQAASDDASVASGYTMGYSSLAAGVASVTSSGVITAVSPGTAKVVRTITSLPSGYQASSFITGDTVLVTVPSPPPQTAITVAHGSGGQGGGVVTSTVPASLGIACTIAVSSSSGTCAGNVPTGTAVTLSAAPNVGYKLSAWGGGCSGSAAACSPSTAGSSVSVTAAFVVAPFQSFSRLECEVNGSQRRHQLAWTITGYPAGTTVTVLTNTVNNVGTATTVVSNLLLYKGSGWWTPFYSAAGNRYFWARPTVNGATPTWSVIGPISGTGPCPLF